MEANLLYDFLCYIGETYGYNLHIGDCLNSDYGKLLISEYLNKVHNGARSIR